MTLRSPLRTVLITCSLLFYCSLSWAVNPLDTLRSIPSSSLFVIDEKKQTIHSKDINKLYIPASTVKILTALIALEHWGKEHRFTTDFYFDENSNYLWIKGYGDPYLISEELDAIVEKLKQAGISELDGIGIDSSYFSKTIEINGQGKSLNPYDASLGAVAANFNTINVRIYSDSISSSEPQTPLTPLAEKLAQGLPVGTHRINLGMAEYGPRYFAELLKAKLNRSSIPTGDVFMSGGISTDLKLLFKHQNTHALEQVITSMLEFSNSFIANQFYLTLGAEIHGSPATIEKSQKVYAQYIKQNFNWSNYILVEGAGLSRLNQLNSKQLVDVLDRFKPYRNLMPSQTPHIIAKSGTLKNVSTYAGYINRNNEWHSFALMINQKVPYNFREQIAIELLK